MDNRSVGESLPADDFGSNFTSIIFTLNENVCGRVVCGQPGEPKFLLVNAVTAPGMYALDGSTEIEERLE